MVTSLLQGGLGNYMFQIAAAQALAWDLGVDAGFDFNLASQVHRNIRSYQDNILSEVKDVRNPRFGVKYNEPNFAYNELPQVDNQLLIGYFQSEKYFKHRRSEILSLFELPDDELEELDRLSDFYDTDNTCAIHVRRGDYIKLAPHHPPLTMDYYTAGMHLANSVKYLIFSDDMEWCKDNFVGSQYIFVDTWHPDYVDMHLMGRCREVIIANSSFSWWGAWLGNPEQVIAPKKWFGPAKGNIITKDMIPEEWLSID